MNPDLINRLKAARTLINLSQKEIERDYSITQSDISLLEGGKKKFIPLEYIDFLNRNRIDLNWLFSGKGDMLLPAPRMSAYPNLESDGSFNSFVVKENIDEPYTQEKSDPIDLRIRSLEDKVDFIIKKIIEKGDKKPPKPIGNAPFLDPNIDF